MYTGFPKRLLLLLDIRTEELMGCTVPNKVLPALAFRLMSFRKRGYGVIYSLKV